MAPRQSQSDRGFFWGFFLSAFAEMPVLPSNTKINPHLLFLLFIFPGITIRLNIGFGAINAQARVFFVSKFAL